MKITRETPRLILISQLKLGVRFTLKGIDGIYVKKTHNEHGITYYKEGLEDLTCCADRPILKVVS